MNLIDLSCPYCHAPLTVENSSWDVTCDYCGRMFFLDDIPQRKSDNIERQSESETVHARKRRQVLNTQETETIPVKKNQNSENRPSEGRTRVNQQPKRAVPPTSEARNSKKSGNGKKHGILWYLLMLCLLAIALPGIIVKKLYDKGKLTKRNAIIIGAVTTAIWLAMIMPGGTTDSSSVIAVGTNTTATETIPLTSTDSTAAKETAADLIVKENADSGENPAENSVISETAMATSAAEISVSTPETAVIPSLTDPTPTAAPTPTQAPELTQIAYTPATSQGPEVKITKNPTSETLAAGGNTWFIAHADNAKSVTWEVIDPNGKIYSLSEAMSKNPGLVLQVLDDNDTIAVSNVPASVNGWGVQAKFDGEGNSTTTSAAYLNITENIVSSGNNTSTLIATGSSMGNAESRSSGGDTTVYITNTGSKYHRDGCRYLKNSKIPKSLSDVRGWYSPCSVCNPPQ